VVQITWDKQNPNAQALDAALKAIAGAWGDKYPPPPAPVQNEQQQQQQKKKKPPPHI
jgi:hypothetical protein